MIAYLNEFSLEQHGDLRRGLILFWKTATELKKANAKLYRDSGFFLQAEFKRKFNHLKVLVLKSPEVETQIQDELETKLPPDLRAILQELAFSDTHWKCWRPARVSGEDDEYVCQDPPQSLHDKSLCEATETKLQQATADVGVVNAEDSVFARNHRLHVSKANSHQTAELFSFASLKPVRDWIAAQHGYYDPASTVAPKDFQTILEKDTERFRRTHKFWNVAGKDRRIYLEVTSNNRFYVDEGHPGPFAHLEVFDADGQHLGVADINTGVIDTSGKVNGRRIQI
jgi:hypothetical protein